MKSERDMCEACGTTKIRCTMCDRMLPRDMLVPIRYQGKYVGRMTDRICFKCDVETNKIFVRKAERSPTKS